MAYNMAYIEMSQSFMMGDGDIAHNLRYRRGRNMRQNGVQERRFINEYIGVDEALLQRCKENRRIDYADEKIKEIIMPTIKPRLMEYNEKQIQTRHSNRVMTVDDWMKKRKHVHNGKERKLFSEYIFTIGDWLTATPYEVATRNFLPIDRDGNAIHPWNTNRKPAYKDGKITESAISKRAKRVYKELIKEIEARNKYAHVIAGAIHGDEGGAIHLHLDICWAVPFPDDPLGIRLGETVAMRQQYIERGKNPPNKRKENAMTWWQAETRELFEEVCLRHGIRRKLMNNTEKHRDIEPFKKYNDARAQEFYEAQRNINEETARERERLQAWADELQAKQDFMDKYIKGIDAREASIEAREKEYEETVRNCGAKAYLLHHYDALKRHPELFQRIHKEVVDEFRKNTKLTARKEPGLQK